MITAVFFISLVILLFSIFIWEGALTLLDNQARIRRSIEEIDRALKNKPKFPWNTGG